MLHLYTFQSPLILSPGVYFCMINCDPASINSNCHFFSLNNKILLYQPFFSETGPPSILQIHYLCNYVYRHQKDYPNIDLYLYCHTYSTNLSNIFIYLNILKFVLHDSESPPSYQRSVQQGKILSRETYPEFRDASSSPSTFGLSVHDCIEGFLKAFYLGWYNLKTFNSDDYQRLQSSENGNINWIIPQKLLAFASPHEFSNVFENKNSTSPEILASIFQQLNITTIIRLSPLIYDETPFIDSGISIHQIDYGPDQAPSLNARTQFLTLLSTERPVAVHCSNGLTKTGTLIACYLVKKFGFSGPQAIAWVRMCRPGSIIGGQQVYINRFADEIQKKSIKTFKRKKSPPKIQTKLNSLNSNKNSDKQIISSRKNQSKQSKQSPTQNDTLKIRPYHGLANVKVESPTKIKDSKLNSSMTVKSYPVNNNSYISTLDEDQLVDIFF